MLEKQAALEEIAALEVKDQLERQQLLQQVAALEYDKRKLKWELEQADNQRKNHEAITIQTHNGLTNRHNRKIDKVRARRAAAENKSLTLIETVSPICIPEISDNWDQNDGNDFEDIDLDGHNYVWSSNFNETIDPPPETVPIELPTSSLQKALSYIPDLNNVFTMPKWTNTDNANLSDVFLIPNSMYTESKKRARLEGVSETKMMVEMGEKED
jgi:hypothetical protein